MDEHDLGGVMIMKNPASGWGHDPEKLAPGVGS